MSDLPGWEREFRNAVGPTVFAAIQADIENRRTLADKHADLAAKYAQVGETILAAMHSDLARQFRRDLPALEPEKT